MKSLSMDLIRTDGGTQMRAELTQEVYFDYRDKWLSGVEFDPVDVFHDGSIYWLADGFHRFYGAREAKLASIKCLIHQGTQRDAILFACKANSAHGLRRTNADKRQAVMAMLNDDEWAKWSDGKIAEQAAVSQNFVSEARRSQVKSDLTSPPTTKRVGRDGKVYEVKTTPQVATVDATVAEPSNGKISGGTTFNVEEFDARDAFGKVVPDDVGEVFDQRPKWEQAMSAISNAKKFVTELKEHAAAVWLDVDETNRLLAQARTNLKFAMPHTECPKCRRKAKKDCPHCKGMGWLNKPTFDSCASDPDKAWLEARK